MKKSTLGLLLVFFGFFISLCCSEAVIRLGNLSKTWNMKSEEIRFQHIVDEFIINYDSIGYTYRPNSQFISVRDKTYHINRWGFRDNPWTLQKPKGKKHVAIIGDSVMEGFGVEENNRAATLLQKWTDLDSVEVFNFSISGYSTYDALYTLKNKVMSFKPEVVVYQISENDLEHNWRLKNNIPLTNNTHSGCKGLLQKHSALYLFLAEKYNYWKLTHQSPKKGHAIAEEKINLEATLLDSIYQACYKNNATIAFVFTPSEPAFLSNDFSLVKAINAKSSKPWEIHPLLLENPLNEDLYFDQYHWNEKGHKQAAKALYQIIKEQLQNQ